MRSWLVIPAAAVVSAGATFGLGARELIDVLALGAAGAALAAAIRALGGDSPAALIGAVLAPLLLITTVFDPQVTARLELARAGIAIAAAAWTIVELARPTTSPLVALLPATVAAALDPSHVALVLIASARLMTAPWQRPRWAIALPAIAALLLVFATIAHLARAGWLADVATRWSGSAPTTLPASAFVMLTASVFGPVTVVAALAGIPYLARARHAELAVASWGLGALLIGVRVGEAGPSIVAVAALVAGLAVARLAGMIRLPVGQAMIGATTSLVLLLPPAWTAIEHGPRVSIAHVAR